MQVHLSSDGRNPNPVWPDAETERTLKGVKRVRVQTGPYDNSDDITIEFDPDTREYRVLHWNGSTDETECVFSILEERP